MPMAEVYTISGARLGAAAASPAVLLQNALKALGVAVGDPQLARLAVDGVIGPATVKAVNYALATYVGGSAQFPRADLTVTRVRQYAGALAAAVTARVQKSGGTVPEPKIQHRAPRRAAVPAAAAAQQATPDDAPDSAPRWVWWTVGGVSVLVVLTLVVGTVRYRRGRDEAEPVRRRATA